VNLAGLGGIVSVCALAYAIVFLFLISFQRRFVFQTYPVVFPPRPSEDFRPSRFVLETADGERLDAMWAEPAATARATILYLHGSATNLRFRSSRIRALTELGFSVLAIDWRGFGSSSGAPSQAGLQLDAEAALAWLARRTDPARVAVLAESIGTGVAIELAAKHRVGALVLEAPYFSMLDLAQRYVPVFPIRRLLRDPLRSDLLIGEIRTNLLIQHGRRDRVVPFAQAERLYAIAPEPKRLIAYPRGGHNDLAERHGSYRDLEAFVVECLSSESDEGIDRAV